MAIKKKNKADIEAGRVRITGFLKKSEYRNMKASMEKMGVYSEASYVVVAITSFNQHILDNKNKKPSSEENG